MVTFPGDGGSDADNVNRWRQQIGLPAAEASALDSMIVPLQSATTQTFSTVDMSGDNARVLAAWTRHDGRVWFFKLTGPKTRGGKGEIEFREISFSPSDSNKDVAQDCRSYHVAEADDRLSGRGDGAHLRRHDCPGSSRHSRSAAALFPKFVCLVAAGRVAVSRFPIFPGGHLIGAVLLINLIAAHAKRFRWAWRKLGIHLTHAGLIVMLAGGLFTDLFAVESHMRLSEWRNEKLFGECRSDELAVIDTTDPEFDQVTAIPEALLRRKRTIEHPSLPFQIVVRNFFQNSRLQMAERSGERRAADRESGTRRAGCSGSGAARHRRG